MSKFSSSGRYCAIFSTKFFERHPKLSPFALSRTWHQKAIQWSVHLLTVYFCQVVDYNRGSRLAQSPLQTDCNIIRTGPL